MQEILDHHPGAPVQVLAVWEPILPTDWRRPTRGTLARLHDRRVAQFWDSRHRVARRLAQDARAPQPEPGCCRSHDILWDLAAVYGRDVRWEEAAPVAILFDGPVVETAERIASILAELPATH